MFLARLISQLDSTLRMNSIFRIRRLAANGARFGFFGWISKRPWLIRHFPPLNVKLKPQQNQHCKINIGLSGIERPKKENPMILIHSQKSGWSSGERSRLVTCEWSFRMNPMESVSSRLPSWRFRHRRSRRWDCMTLCIVRP